MLIIGADELNGEVKRLAVCPNCGHRHVVEYGNKIEKDGSLIPSKTLGYVKCPGNDASYLVAIDGKELKPVTAYGRGK